MGTEIIPVIKRNFVGVLGSPLRFARLDIDDNQYKTFKFRRARAEPVAVSVIQAEDQRTILINRAILQVAVIGAGCVALLGDITARANGSAVVVNDNPIARFVKFRRVYRLLRIQVERHHVIRRMRIVVISAVVLHDVTVLAIS